MPRDETHFTYGYAKRGHGHSYITAEEAAGIGILTVILGILLFVGCWYCKRRSGYRTLKDKNFHGGAQSTLTGRCPCEGVGHQDSKLPFQENTCESGEQYFILRYSEKKNNFGESKTVKPYVALSPKSPTPSFQAPTGPVLVGTVSRSPLNPLTSAWTSDRTGSQCSSCL